MPLISKPNKQQTKNDIRNQGQAGVRIALKLVQRAHEQLVSPWDHAYNKPTFTPEVKVSFRLVIGQLLMEGQEAEKARITVWQLLNKGTDVRYMQLEDWQSKTAPGRTTSGPGGGVKLGINKFMPQPGIEARDFDDSIAEEREQDVDSLIEAGWDSGFRQGVGR